MATQSWEKPIVNDAPKQLIGQGRLKFVIGGLLMLAAVVYLITASTISGAQYFITVEQLIDNPEYVGQPVRISGAVDGATIQYNSDSLILDFAIANVPVETGDLALTLHNAVNDPSAARLNVHIEGEVKPDLLQHEAQAILTGTLGTDGTFHATELLLKCPSRYEESVPAQAEASTDV